MCYPLEKNTPPSDSTSLMKIRVWDFFLRFDSIERVAH